jgi:recombinational DNA repair protein RecR
MMRKTIKVYESVIIFLKKMLRNHEIEWTKVLQGTPQKTKLEEQDRMVMIDSNQYTNTKRKNQKRKFPLSFYSLSK